MIALDTSALIEVVLGGELADACTDVLADGEFIISAGTLAEALIVAGQRNLLPELRRLLASLDLVVEDVTADAADRVAAAYRRWGKGVHPAGLNYGDCFAYALAEARGCPLLFVGQDFARTDISIAMA